MMIINNNNFRLYYGDALTVLKESLSSESVDCVITSSDYWQLRGDTDILPGEIRLEEKFKAQDSGLFFRLAKFIGGE